MKIQCTSETPPAISTIYTIAYDKGCGKDQTVIYQLEKRVQGDAVQWRWWCGPQPADLAGTQLTVDTFKTLCIAHLTRAIL